VLCQLSYRHPLNCLAAGADLRLGVALPEVSRSASDDFNTTPPCCASALRIRQIGFALLAPRYWGSYGAFRPQIEQTAGDCQVVRYRGIRKPPGFVAFSTTSARGFAATEAFARPANQSPCVCAFRTRELIHLRSTPCRNSMGVSSNFPPVASPGLQPSRGLLANPSITAEPNQYPPRNFPAIPLLALPTQSAMCS
jgi:hypothetical protein